MSSEQEILKGFGLRETNSHGLERTIYLHRVPLQRNSGFGLEVMSHEAVQVGDLIHDFGADGDSQMAYAVLRFDDWVKSYPEGKRCDVGGSYKRDGEIALSALQVRGGEYGLWSNNCQHVSRSLICSISHEVPSFPPAPLEGAKLKFEELQRNQEIFRFSRKSPTGSFLGDMVSDLLSAVGGAILFPKTKLEIGNGRIPTGFYGVSMRETHWEKRVGGVVTDVSSSSFFSSSLR